MKFKILLLMYYALVSTWRCPLLTWIRLWWITFVPALR